MTRLTRALLAAVLFIPLAGCISLLPKAKPSQLYRFGTEVSEPAGPSSRASFGVLKTPATFVQAAASDRILTVTQGEAAYIKDARWVSPAAVLFDEAVARTFQGGGPARLVTRGVGELSAGEIGTALESGAGCARKLLAAGLIDGAALRLHGKMITVAARAIEISKAPARLGSGATEGAMHV